MVIDNEVWLEACCHSAHCYIPFPSNVCSSFSSVLVQFYGYMYVCMCKCFVVQGLKYQASVRFNQFQAQIFFCPKRVWFLKSYIAVTKHSLFPGSVSCKYNILSISSTATHCLRSSRLSLLCSTCVSLPSSMHFARVEFFYFW